MYVINSIRIATIGIIFFSLGGCAPSGPGPDIEACVGRGIAYFKEIDAYPTLKSAPNAGRSADEVARERCQRTVTAF